MQILIATAGALPPSKVVALVDACWSPGSSIWVMASIEVPRSFLEDLETEKWRPFAEGEVSPEYERAISRYVEERGKRLVEPIVAGLDAAGFAARPVFVDSHDPAAAIVGTASELGAELLVMGATRPIFTEDVWQSVAVKVMQASPIPVVMVPGVARSVDTDSQDELSD